LPFVAVVGRFAGPFFKENRSKMGKLDRRNSLKMKRRKAQAAKKEREKRPSVAKATETITPAKKARAPKAAAAPTE
jgi:hypothetical protein